MRVARTVLMHCIIGLTVALLSTFAGERSASAIYPEIMGCEKGCHVVATGWPFIFIKDYLGMSVVNAADIMEVWFAADRFRWAPFLADVGFWATTSFVLTIFWRSATAGGRISAEGARAERR